MMFENTHGLASDGLVGPKVWRELVADALAGKRRDAAATPMSSCTATSRSR